MKTPRHLEVNAVLDTDDGQLRGSGRLLRIREANGRVVLTFKDVVVSSGAHKSREEIEFEASSAPAAVMLFSRLGYRERFRYEKYRTEFTRLGDPGIVTLDETPIGDFFELEGPAPWIDSTAAKLGFEEGQYITESYGRLYLDWCQHNRVAPSNMTFHTPVPPR